MHPKSTTAESSVQLICEVCSCPFSIPKAWAKRGQGRYCGPVCSGKAHRTKKCECGCGAYPGVNRRRIAGHKASTSGHKAIAPSAAPLSERFWERVDRASTADGCWTWTGTLSGGYGCIYTDGKQRRATWVSWLLHYGEPPEGMFLLHRCDNPPCVRPDHLFLGTQKDNNQDMWAKGRGKLVHYQGGQHGRATMTEEQVAALRERYRQGGITQRALARETGIPRGTIQHMLSGATWKNVS